MGSIESGSPTQRRVGHDSGIQRATDAQRKRESDEYTKQPSTVHSSLQLRNKKTTLVKASPDSPLKAVAQKTLPCESPIAGAESIRDRYATDR